MNSNDNSSIRTGRLEITASSISDAYYKVRQKYP
jgi:hypothetical protein